MTAEKAALLGLMEIRRQSSTGGKSICEGIETADRHREKDVAWRAGIALIW